MREFLDTYFPARRRSPSPTKYIRKNSGHADPFEVVVHAGIDNKFVQKCLFVSARSARSSGEAEPWAALAKDLSDESSPLRERVLEGCYVIEDVDLPVLCVHV